MDVLWGLVNPGGKLTIPSGGWSANFRSTMPPPSADVDFCIEGPHAPFFPFGHGLSYAS